MSDPMNPAAPAARERPSTVTISSYLLMLVAALQVINFILSVSLVGKITDVMRELYAGTPAEGAENFAVIGVIVGSAVPLLLGIGLFVLAILNNRGKNAARITTWVIGGIAACCTGFSIVGSAAQSFGPSQGGDVPSGAEVQRRLNEVLPGWYRPVTILIAVLVVLALLTALILLALPKSNEFFRKPQATWEPPVPGSAYPGYPPSGGPGGVPGQQPGYQQPGYQQPGYQQPMPPPGGQPGSPPPGGSEPPYPPSR